MAGCLQQIQETSFSTEAAGNTLRYAIFFTSANSDVSPSIDEFVLEYEEGYPDRPMLDVGGDGTYDWESDIFLNEFVVASDDSPVGEIVKRAPTLVDAFNDHIPENGDGTVNIPIAVKAASSGRGQDPEHRHHVRHANPCGVDASLEGGLASPDGLYRNFITRSVAPGDDVEFVTKAVIAIEHAYGDNPSLHVAAR